MGAHDRAVTNGGLGRLALLRFKPETRQSYVLLCTVLWSDISRRTQLCAQHGGRSGKEHDADTDSWRLPHRQLFTAAFARLQEERRGGDP